MQVDLCILQLHNANILFLLHMVVHAKEISING